MIRSWARVSRKCANLQCFDGGRLPRLRPRLAGPIGGNWSRMNDDKKRLERTATDDRIDENREPAPIAPVTGDPERSGPGGVPSGQSDDQRSPLEPAFYQTLGKAPALSPDRS